MHVDAAGMEMNRSGAIVGKIQLLANGAAFPSEGWWDFPVILLSWWIESLRRLGDSQGVAVDLMFMDGPHEVRAVMVDSHRIEAVLLSESVEQRRTEWDRAELTVDLRIAAAAVLDICAAREWDTPDVRALRSNLRGAT